MPHSFRKSANWWALASQGIRRSKPSTARIRREALQPVVERLEDRTLLSTLGFDRAGQLSYVAGRAVANNLTVSLERGVYTFRDRAETIVTTDMASSNCSGGGTSEVACPSDGIRSILVDLGDMDDEFHAPSADDPLTVMTGDGSDKIVTSAIPVEQMFDGGAESDVYDVILGLLSGAITIADSGTRGADRLNVNATALFDVVTTETSAAGDSVGDGRSDKRLDYRGIEELAVDSGGPEIQALRELQRDSQTTPRIRYQGSVPRFAAMMVPVPVGTTADPIVRAINFLDQYRELYRLSDPRQQLFLTRIRSDDGEQHVHFGQRHDGIPVFGSSISVHMAGDLVRMTTANYLPEIPSLGPTELTKREAATIALAAVSDANPRISGETKLAYFNESLLGGPDTRTHLAWRASVRGGQGGWWTVFVDAHTGQTLLVLDESPHAVPDKNFTISTVNNTSSSSCWSAPFEDDDDTWFDEDGADGYPGAGADPFLDGADAFDFLHEVYNFFHNNFGRHSHSGWNGSWEELMVHVSVNQFSPPGSNASYSTGCDLFQFSDGNVTLEVVGHEFTHGIDNFEAGLVYTYQPGALDESYADVFGALISGDWVIGDGSAFVTLCKGYPAGAIRDMSNPPACEDPDHISEFAETSIDNGGVHKNSGIMNKVAFLIADGGVHPDTNVLVKGIGRKKLGELYYKVHTMELFFGSLFLDARDETVATAEWFANPNNEFADVVFTQNDVCQVINAFAAVGLSPESLDQDCDGTPDNADAWVDTDNDSKPDAVDNCIFVANPGQEDLYGNGIGDACDPDDDQDGVPEDGAGNGDVYTPCKGGGTTDCDDNAPNTPNPDQADADSDGLGDVVEDEDGDFIKDVNDKCPDFYSQNNNDNDGDDLGDPCDPDDDDDGILDDGDDSGWEGDHPCTGGKTIDCDDNSPKDSNPSQQDSDGDLTGDASDNCATPNPDQSDLDEDGVGDACDSDIDGDEVSNADDNCPLADNPDQFDGDNNGQGFACDALEQFVATAHTLKFGHQGPIRIPIDPCLCPDYIPEDFLTEVTVQLPFDLPTNIVDDRGFIVAKSKTGTKKSLQFRPKPELFYKAPAAPQQGAMSENSGLASILGRSASDTMAPERLDSEDPAAYRGIAYFLEIFPTAQVELGTAYDIRINVISARSDETRDITPPWIEDVPADMVVEATSQAGTVVEFATPNAIDVGDPNPFVACSPPSGSMFPMGTTEVSCTATDNQGNSRLEAFRVTVVPDKTGPTVKRVERIADNRKRTGILVSFEEDLNPQSAESLNNYALVKPGKDAILGTRDDKATKLRRATYDSLSHTVTLSARIQTVTDEPLQITIHDSLTDWAENPLDGDADGQSGGDYVAIVPQQSRSSFVHRDATHIRPGSKIESAQGIGRARTEIRAVRRFTSAQNKPRAKDVVTIRSPSRDTALRNGLVNPSSIPSVDSSVSDILLVSGDLSGDLRSDGA